MRGGLSLTHSYYEALRRLTLQLAGVQMGSDHAFLVETRLSDLARKEGYDTLDAMVEDLFATGQSQLALHVVSTLVERDTHFNRDTVSFDALFEHVLPDLVEKRGGGRIDLLSYGCGSGQDLYSIAIKARDPQNAQILTPVSLHLKGVDYPSQALERARAGRYTHFEIQRGLSVRDMLAHFTPDPTPGSTDWLVASHLRENVTFEDAHLMADKGQRESCHVILFRGTVKHLSRSARYRVSKTLTLMLRHGGYLILGSDDSMAEINAGFSQIDGYPGVFRRHDAIVEPVGKQPTNRTTFEGAKARRSNSH
ncbi:MAG: CheR family methyltransferase [Pseudomonadota bacterium]